METKEFWKSKTFWFNILALVVFIAGQFGFADFEPNSDVTMLGLGIVAVINLVLRFITNQGIEPKLRLD